MTLIQLFGKDDSVDLRAVLDTESGRVYVLKEVACRDFPGKLHWEVR